ERRSDHDTRGSSQETQQIQSHGIPFDHGRRQKDRSFCQKADDLCSGRLVRYCVLYTKRKGEAHGCVEDREGSHHRHSERGRFLRGRLPCRAASPSMLRNRNDRSRRDECIWVIGSYSFPPLATMARRMFCRRIKVSNRISSRSVIKSRCIFSTVIYSSDSKLRMGKVKMRRDKSLRSLGKGLTLAVKKRSHRRSYFFSTLVSYNCAIGIQPPVAHLHIKSMYPG